MAVSAIKVTLGTDLGEGKFNSKASYPPDPVVAAAAVPSFSDVTAAIAVLVDDGDSPTQAHVTTLNDAYTTLLADEAAYEAAVQASVAGDLIVLIDTAVITTGNAYRWAIQKALHMAKNIGIVSP